MLSAVTSLQLFNADQARTKATAKADPLVKREVEYFQANIGNVKTAKEFVGNYRLFSFAMKAYGLEDMAFGTAFMQKMLEGGLIDQNSMANKISDPRFRDLVRAYDFGDSGLAATSNASNISATVDNYIQQTIEENAGAQNSGARLALYFQRKASTITSGMGIMADKALYQFAQTLLNIPAASENTMDATAKYIESKINIADLKDPAKVKKLVDRFAIMWDADNTDTSSNPAVMLMSSVADSASSFSGLDGGLLASVQKLYSRF